MKKEEKRKKNIFKIKVFIICLLIIFSVGFLGSLFTSGNSDSQWYDSVKPSITPPSYWFPIVWNIIFLLIAISLYISWIKISKIKNKKQRQKNKKKIILVFGINFILNVLWSLLFFELRVTKIAFFELIIFLISISLMISMTKKIDKTSSLLLIPYLLWVSFAGVLNFLVAF